MTKKTKKTENQILRTFSRSSVAFCAVAVFFSFIVVTLLLLAIGRNPSGLYQAIFQAASGFDFRRGGWNARYIGEWLVISLPLILCGLSAGFSFRSGLFNLGAEGQYIAGLTAAQVVVLSFSRSMGQQVSVFHLIIIVLCAMAAGALWGAVAGFFKARFKVWEILTTVMMNYIALYIHRLVTMKIPGSSITRTPDFPAIALSNPMLASLTNNSRLNNGLWLTIAAVILFWFIWEKTSGNTAKAVILIKSNITIVMAVSGAFAGLAGAVVSLGMFTHGRVLSSFDGYGFIGIAAALCGNCTALGISIMGSFFGILNSARPLLQSRQIPGEIVFIIMGLIVVFISMRAGKKASA